MRCVLALPLPLLLAAVALPDSVTLDCGGVKRRSLCPNDEVNMCAGQPYSEGSADHPHCFYRDWQEHLCYMNHCERDYETEKASEKEGSRPRAGARAGASQRKIARERNQMLSECLRAYLR